MKNCHCFHFSCLLWNTIWALVHCIQPAHCQWSSQVGAFVTSWYQYHRCLQFAVCSSSNICVGSCIFHSHGCNKWIQICFNWRIYLLHTKVQSYGCVSWQFTWITLRLILALRLLLKPYPQGTLSQSICRCQLILGPLKTVRKCVQWVVIAKKIRHLLQCIGAGMLGEILKEKFWCKGLGLLRYSG
jgi:hypothetical protein